MIGYRFFLGMSEAEIAGVLGVRRGTVKSRCSRALARIRARLPVEFAQVDVVEASDA